MAFYDRSGPVPAPGQSALQASKTVGPELKALNAQWAVVDVSTATVQSWVKDARAAGIPALIVAVQGPGSKALAFEAIPLPADENGVIAEIKRIRGVTSTITPSPQMTRVVELLTEIKATLRRDR